jgi:hypothetical protein
MFRYTDPLELLKEKKGRSIWRHVAQNQRKRKRVAMRSIYLYSRQEMNTGSIGRSMNRMLTELRNPDQVQAANITCKKLAASLLLQYLCRFSSTAFANSLRSISLLPSAFAGHRSLAGQACINRRMVFYFAAGRYGERNQGKLRVARARLGKTKGHS